MPKQELGYSHERESLKASVNFRLKDYRQAVSRYKGHITGRHGGKPVTGCHDCQAWQTQIEQCSSELDIAQSRLSMFDYNNQLLR